MKDKGSRCKNRIFAVEQKKQKTMNSNFLCNVYGVRGYSVTGQCHKDNKTILKIERKHVKICCRHCGNIGISLDGSRIRDILGVPFGLRKTLLRVRIRRYRCPKCGHVCQESVPFVTGNRHYSHRFAQYAAVLLKTCTIKSVASLLSVSWDTVKRIHKEYLRRRYTPVSPQGRAQHRHRRVLDKAWRGVPHHCRRH